MTSSCSSTIANSENHEGNQSVTWDNSEGLTKFRVNHAVRRVGVSMGDSPPNKSFSRPKADDLTVGAGELFYELQESFRWCVLEQANRLAPLEVSSARLSNRRCDDQAKDLMESSSRGHTPKNPDLPPARSALCHHLPPLLAGLFESEITSFCCQATGSRDERMTMEW